MFFVLPNYSAYVTDPRLPAGPTRATSAGNVLCRNARSGFTSRSHSTWSRNFVSVFSELTSRSSEGGHFTCRLVLEEGRDGKLPVVCGEMITSDSSATRHRQQWHGWPTKDERKQGFPLLKHLSEDEPAEVVLGRRAPGIPVDREGPRKPAKNPKAAPRKKTSTRTSAKKTVQKTTMQAKKQATKTKLARRPTRKAAKPAINLSDDEDSDIDCDSMDIDEPSCSSPLTDYSRSETAVADETSFDTASTIVDDLDTASDDKYTGEKTPTNMMGLANSDDAAAVEALLFLSNSGAPKHTSLSCASTSRTPPTSASAPYTLSAARWSPPSNGLYLMCAAMDFREGTESARFPEASSHTSYSYSYPPVPPPRHQY